MDYDKATVVSVSVVSENPEHIVKAAEVFARAAAGLVLDGIMVNLSMGQGEDEDD
jgi:hypothetical protein